MNSTQSTIDIRLNPAQNRGRTQLGWLDSHHSFSFGQFQDPTRAGFGPLRVINDDLIAPGSGFGEHPHQNMEILTWVLKGALKHGDSLANAQTLNVGELQAMSAGSGIRHSEFNASKTEIAHFLQIWIEPRTQGLEPRYAQRTFPRSGRLNRWQTLAINDQLAATPGDDSPLPIAQDATLKVADIQGEPLNLATASGRSGYLHVALGSVEVKTPHQNYHLNAGDALSWTSHEDSRDTLTTFTLSSNSDQAQVLWFDLP